MEPIKFKANAPEDLLACARHIAANMPNSLLLLVEGGLGVGKTTLAKYFFQELGAEHVVSPTFGLIHEYTLTRDERSLFHLDLYRAIPAHDELEEILSNSKAIVYVEWADLMPELAYMFPFFEGEIWRINISITSGDSREIVIYKM